MHSVVSCTGLFKCQKKMDDSFAGGRLLLHQATNRITLDVINQVSLQNISDIYINNITGCFVISASFYRKKRFSFSPSLTLMFDSEYYIILM